MPGMIGITHIEQNGIAIPAGVDVTDRITRVLGIVGSCGMTLSETPTITAGAYAAGDNVGGILAFTNAIAVSGGDGVLKTVTIVDDSGQAAETELWLFDRTFTAGVDNAAWAPSDADMENCIAVVSTAGGTWYTGGTGKFCDIEVAKRIDLEGTILFGRLVTRGTPTYTATDNLTVKVGMLNDCTERTLSERLLSTAPIACWPLWDALGAVAAEDISGNAFDGVPSNVTFGEEGIGDGYTCASCDGTLSYINVYSAGLAAAFDGSEGSLFGMFRVPTAGTWTDGVQRRIATFAVADSTRLSIGRSGDNAMSCNYRANNVQETVPQTIGDQVWHRMLMTWSATEDAVRGYYDRTALAPSLALGAWAGALSATRTTLGAANTTPLTSWLGEIAYITLWDYPLAETVALDLTTA